MRPMRGFSSSPQVHSSRLSSMHSHGASDGRALVKMVVIAAPKEVFAMNPMPTSSLAPSSGSRQDPRSATPSTAKSLANVSLLCSLLPLVTAALIALAVLNAPSASAGVPPSGSFLILLSITGILGTLTLPASITAVVTGHLALSRAKSLHAPEERRGRARVGLVLGYLTLGFVVLVGVIFFVADMRLQGTL